MEIIICIILLIVSSLIYLIAFKINIKKAKELECNKKIENITNKFPENKEIAKEMLELLGKKDVKIEEQKETKTSLYIAIQNKIIIADMKNNYARIQTIAHEVLHSCQDRRLLMFNFALSNIGIFYYIIAIILTITKTFQNHILQLFILLLIGFISFGIRIFLEIDAMTKSRYLSEKYIEFKDIVSKQEETEVLEAYDNINKAGIPFYVCNLFITAIIRVIIYAIIALIF